MDLVHDVGSMDPVHESGPWTWSKEAPGPCFVLTHLFLTGQCPLTGRYLQPCGRRFVDGLYQALFSFSLTHQNVIYKAKRK